MGLRMEDVRFHSTVDVMPLDLLNMGLDIYFKNVPSITH